jgi:GLPGLI family protein
MKNRNLILCAVMLLTTSAAMAQKGKSVVITYSSSSNGKPSQGPGMQLVIDGDREHVMPAAAKKAENGNKGKAEKEKAEKEKPAPPKPKEQQFIDFREQATYQVLTLNDGRRFTLKKPFSDYEKPQLLPDTATILGYLCKKAKVVIRSNNIEIWYTNALPVNATPSLSVAPGLGAILKIVRNGNYETTATDISFRAVKLEELNWPAEQGEMVDDAAYQYQVIESRYTTLPVFNQEQLSFGNDQPNPAANQANVTYHYAGGTLVLKKVHLPALQKGETLFAELTQFSNGDAYDRTGSVFVIPMDKEKSFLDGLQQGVKALPVYKGKYQGVVATDNYLPLMELMRFFTPFGVHHFNNQVKIKGYNWADSAVFREDITGLQARLQGDVWIGVFIGNYDKGGHKVSLRLKYYPGDDDDNSKPANWLLPIFNTTNVMEMAGQEYGTMFDHDSLTVTVNIPEGVSNLRLQYTTTGHGGWGGGDEFNPKLNEIFVDNERVYHFIPWRTDCGAYRLLNPASGNFGNGLSSSDLSRSNWCPGSLTVPITIPLPDVKPGTHTFKVAIPLGPREGGSFSAWNVSGTLLGDKQ